MARSTEYPDLSFVEPNSWTAGRNGRKPQLIVVHTTEGHEHFTAAEDGAAYDARRTDGTSTHYFHDPDSTVQCVLTKDTAHHARTHGNRIGIGHEHCGTAGQTTQQWDDSNSNAILRRGAKQAARDAKKWGFKLTDIRRLSVAEVRTAYYSNANLKGFCGHVDITYAFPEDEGTHTDPGSHFPWNEYLQLVRDEFTGDNDMTPADMKNLLLTDKELRKSLAELPWSADIISRGVPETDPNPNMTTGFTLGFILTVIDRLKTGLSTKLDEVLAAALDDDNFDVMLDPSSLSVLQEIKSMVDNLPEAVASEEARRLES